jgi:hypothetical protein
MDVRVDHTGADPEAIATDHLQVRGKATGCGRTDVVHHSLAVDDHRACERFDGSARPDRAEQNRASGQSALLEAIPVSPRPNRVTARENPPDHAAADTTT